MRLPLLVLAFAGFAGCGSGREDRAAPPPGDAYRAQADAACVEFRRFPISSLVEGGKNPNLERLSWLDEELRAALPAEPPPPGVYRQRIVDPVQRMSRRIRRAIDDILGGAPPERTAAAVHRAQERLRRSLFASARELKLERCVRAQTEADEQEAAFRRAAARICTRAGARAPARLAELEPPPRLSPLWRSALRALRDQRRGEALRAFRRLGVRACGKVA